MESKKICVIGLGYIGLPTAALLANRGYRVHGVDVVQKVVDTINEGKVHIIEPGLDSFVQSAVQSGNLKAHVTPVESDVFMIAVPTPLAKDNKPDITYVISATEAIAPFIKEGDLIILESTSPVGTTEKVRDVLEASGIDTGKVHLAYCPERVLPGNTIIELVKNDRIVGGINPAAAQAGKEFYSTFVEGEILTTNARTAEMSKLTENAYRDTNIAFANELSILCDELEIDVWELIGLANHHPRVNILQPGSGVGGHCIAVDPWFIISSNEDQAGLMKTARQKNLYKTEWAIGKVKNAILQFKEQHSREPKVACMGLAFKPDIDDLRESPALYITSRLMEDGLQVIPVEPNIETYKDWPLQAYDSALREADIVVYLVNHKEFKALKPNGKQVIDFCGIR